MIRSTGILCLAFKRCAQRPNTLHIFQIPPYHVVQSANVVSIYQASCLSSVVASEPAEAGNEKTQPKNNSKSEEKTPEPLFQSKRKFLDPRHVSKLLESVETTAISKDAARHTIEKLKTLSKSGGLGNIETDPRFIQLQKQSSEANRRLVGAELIAVMKVQSLSKAMDILDTLPPTQQIAVMKNLALNNTRTVPLLDKIAGNLRSKKPSLNVKDSSDVLFSMASLNYPNVELLQFISKNLKTSLPKCTQPSVVGSAVTSLRKLLWRDEELLAVISKWVEANISVFRNPSNFFYTLAILNYVPKNHRNLFKLMWDRVRTESPNFNDTVIAVWSLVVLEKANNDHFSYIFQQEQYKAMAVEGEPELPTMVRLLNINAAAKQSETYTGPYLPESLCKMISMPVSAQKRATVEQLRDMLFSRMDDDLYETFFPTEMGFFIDLICALKSTGEPVPIKSKENCTRVAVRAVHFHDTTLPAKLITGHKVLEQRLMERKGYKVITFPHEKMSCDTPAEKFHEFFKDELNKALDS